MKYLYTLALVFLSAISWGQCIPSAIDTNALLYPVPDTSGGAVLVKDVYYGDTITINVPSDTTISNPLGGGTITVTVDSLVLNSVIGLPPGMTYGCHNSSCKSLGGEQGCLHYYGTPQVADTFIVKVSGAAYTSVLPFTFEEEFPLIVVASTGVKKIEKNHQLSIFPNPSKEFVNISLAGSNDEAEIEMYSILGSQVYQGTLTQGKAIVSTQEFPAGYYIVSVKTEGQTYTKQLAVIK